MSLDDDFHFHPEARAEFLADIDWFEERRSGYWRDRVSR